MGHDKILLIEILRADQKCDKHQDLATKPRLQKYQNTLHKSALVFKLQNTLSS